MKDNKIKIAIHGSCCSREIFNSSLNNFDLGVYLFQNPLHTMFEKPFSLEIKEDEILNKSNFMRRMVASEFNKKALQTLNENKADYLMIDVGDLRLGRFNICFNNGTKTRIFKTHDTQKQLFYLQDKLKNFDFDIESNKDIPEKEWDYLIDRYVSEIKKIYSIDKIIFNRLAIATQYEKNGIFIDFTEKTGVDAFISKHLLLKLQNKLERKLKGCLILDNPSFPIIADSSHNLGLHPLHLKQDVYDYKMKKLQEILMKEKYSTTQHSNIIYVKNAQNVPDTQAEIIIQNKINYSPKVSVIIPVYNVEDFLRECLDSVVNQTLKEIEIICIDDGSTDKSFEILKKYATKDNRITVIKQKNLYAGVARNAGLAVATGEYVHFLDSDDWVNLDTYDELYCLIKEKKVNFMKFKSFSYDNKEKKIINEQYTDINWITKDLIISIDEKLDWAIKMSDAPWSGFYKLSFLNKNNIRFNNLICANDISFFISCLIKNRFFYFTTKKFVYYRINNDKSLIGIRPFNFNCQIETYHIINKIAQNESQMIKQALKVRYSTQILMWCNRYMNDCRLDISTKQNIYKLTKDFFEKNQDLLCKNDFNNIHLYKVSIIMPCYNTAPYLRQALDSVVNQTLKDIEIICVNDGSTDNTLDIIKEYATKDNRIVVIDGPNGGYGKAMNKGLDKATGEYIGILEPDDYLKLDMYETQYKIAKENNLDFIKADFYRFVGDNYDYNHLSKNPKDYNIVCKPIEKLETFLFIMNTWSGIYRRDFIEKFNIRHNETPGASFQDNGFFFQTFCFAERAMFLDKPFYMNRRDNPNSSVKSKAKVYCMNEEYEYIKELLIKNNLFTKVKEIYEILKFYNYMFTLTRIDNSFKLQYIIDIAEEFRKDRIEYNLAYTFFNQWDKEKIKLLMTSPANFYNKYIAENEKQEIMVPKISIIIPVYNVELYLEECLDSIINQPLKEIEIICVNDGSTDKSLNILEKYEKKDKRIKIINQENNGLSGARNSGLKIAIGEYVFFIDSDDYILRDSLEKLYIKAKKDNVQILIFSAITEPQKLSDENKWLKSRLTQSNKQYTQFSKGIIFSEITARPFVWNKLFNLEFLRNFNLVFCENIKFGEDQIFLLMAYSHVQRLSFYDYVAYVYRVNRIGSLMDVAYNNLLYKIDKHIDILLIISEYWEKINFLNSYKIDFFEWALEFIQIYNIKTFSIEERSKLAKKALDLLHYFDISFKDLSINGKKLYKELLSCMSDFSEILVSIIIPVYNAESFLPECLDSLLNQSLSNIEIICVDDGSTDKSLEILNKYAITDNRIKILQQKNMYAGVARNNGLKIAKGKYVIFLDSDDFFELNMLEEMFFQCEKDKADICLCNARHYNNKTKEYIDVPYLLNMANTPSKLPFSYKDCPNTFYQITTSAPWNKLYRKSFLKENNIEYLDYKKAEDVFFTNIQLILAEKITVINKKFTNYRIETLNSAQATNHEAPLDFYYAFKKTKETLENHNIYKNVKNSFTQMALSNCLYNLKSLKTGNAFEELYNKLKNECFSGLGISSNINELSFIPNWMLNEYKNILEHTPATFLFKQKELLESKINSLENELHIKSNQISKVINDNKQLLESQKVINLNALEKKNNTVVVNSVSQTTTQSPLLFKDIGFGCKTWCEPKNITGNDIKSFTYDLTDNIYIRYVSWDPIKEGSCDVEIKRLHAVEKRSKKIIEFPVNKIVSSGKIIGNKIEFRNQKGCWIGCTIEGAYESFTIEAKINNL